MVAAAGNTLFRSVTVLLALSLATLFCTTSSSTAQAEEVVTFESTITGSQEQPKVIYIVPWQPPKAPGEMRQSINDLVMQDLLQPIDRDTFLRQVQFRAQLNERAAGALKAQ